MGAFRRQGMVDRMFEKADKDKSETVSLDEFRQFIKNDAQQERDAHAQELRDKVADNMEQHGGQIHKTVQAGNMTRSVDVEISGVDPDKIRAGRHAAKKEVEYTD